MPCRAAPLELAFSLRLVLPLDGSLAKGPVYAINTLDFLHGVFYRNILLFIALGPLQVACSDRAAYFATHMADRSLHDMLPFGKAPPLLLLTTVVAGLFMVFNPVAENRATMRLWTFARNHSARWSGR